MAKGAQELYDFLTKLGKNGDPVLPGIVEKVNGDDTIDVKADGLTYYEVRMKAAVANGLKGIKPIPALGSVVIMERIGDEKSNEYQVALYSELDEYTIEIATAKLLIDATGFSISKGADSLKDILKLIIEAVKKIMVLQGNNPDFIKLAQAETKLDNVFNA